MIHKVFQPGDEPVPGYVLDQFLGRGGFGEVWKAKGPGGVSVALKVIHDLDRKKGGKELKALRLLKDIRHPNLVPVTAFWLRGEDGAVLWDTGEIEKATGDTEVGDDTHDLHPTTSIETATQLVIAMSLAEGSLYDRLKTCHSQLLAGIPVDELLTYMEDSARAIDLLNSQHSIQHCDIKPQNILVLGGAAQVCDFGLATAIGDVRETSMNAGTIAYGAPEVLTGSGPSEATDQYSLAISYYELRTGQLPFASERISDVFEAKQNGELVLTNLSDDERAVILRAAAIDPADRFASCSEMVRALRDCRTNDTQVLPVSSATKSQVSLKDPSKQDAKKKPVALIAGAAVAGMLVVGALLLALSSSSNKPVAEEDKPTPIVIHDKDTRRIAEATESAAISAQNAADHSRETADNTREATDLSRETAYNTRDTAEHTRETAYNTRETADHTRDTATNTRETADTARVIADNTRQTADATRQTAANTREIADSTREIVSSVKSLQKSFEASLSRGALILRPQQSIDYYQNARVLESRGENVKAREAYKAYFVDGQSYVDPHYHFQALLKSQEGPAGARRVYQAMVRSSDNIVTRFAEILLDEGESKIDRLKAFTEQYPYFAPAVYELSLEFSAERLGVQALGDKREEKRALEQFMRLSEEGRLLGSFLDQSMARKMVGDAKQRLTALKVMNASIFETPVTLSGFASNAGWHVQLAVSEATREIFFKTSVEDEFESTGFVNYVDQRTGTRMPKPSIELPLGTSSQTVIVQYRDVRNILRGPFELKFDPQIEMIRSKKQVLDVTKTSWISFRDFRGKKLAYFSHLVSSAGAIDEIRYSLDDEELDLSFPLPAADPKNPHRVPPEAKIYIEVPETLKSLAVQLTFADGTKSKVQVFRP